MNRSDVVAEARSWLGTPFRHQQAEKGVACDCAGMVGGVLIRLGVYPERENIPGLSKFLGYSRIPDGRLIKEACDTFLVPIRTQDMQAGDIVLMRFDEYPQHCAYLGDYRHGGISLIHALEPSGKVVEHRMDAVWRSRIVAAYSVPGL